MDGCVDLVEAVRHADETGFVEAGIMWTPYSKIEVKNFLKVAASQSSPSRSLRSLRRLKQAEYRADAVETVVQAFGRQQVSHACLKSGAELLNASIRVLLLHLAELGDAGDHRQRVAAEGCRLTDRAVRCEIVHDLGLAAVGAERQTAANHLAHGSQVRADVVDGGFIGLDSTGVAQVGLEQVPE